MPSPVSSTPFHTLAASLAASGFTAQAAQLQGVLDGCWTSSSEMIGELGTAVLQIRRECRPLSAQQKALVQECLREVRKAWPGFGMFDWLRLRRK